MISIALSEIGDIAHCIVKVPRRDGFLYRRDIAGILIGHDGDFSPIAQLGELWARVDSAQSHGWHDKPT